MVARRVPELPGGDAGRLPRSAEAARMPRRRQFGPVLPPKVRMPPEAEDRLPAHATMSWSAPEGRFTIGGGRDPERAGQPIGPGRVDAPNPIEGRAASPRQRPRAAIGAQGVRP